MMSSGLRRVERGEKLPNPPDLKEKVPFTPRRSCCGREGREERDFSAIKGRTGRQSSFLKLRKKRLSFVKVQNWIQKIYCLLVRLIQPKL